MWPGPGTAHSLPAISTPTSLGSGTSSGAGVTTSLNYSASVPAGALVVVEMSNSNLLTYTTLTDTCGNTFSAITAAGNNVANNNVVALWYKENATACASGQTLTGTSSVGTANRTIAAVYVTGIIASGSLDKSANGTSGSGVPSIATGTMAQANEIIIGATTSNGTITASSSAAFTQSLTATPPNSDMEYRIVAATTTQNFAPTTASSGAGVVLGTFKGN